MRIFSLILLSLFMLPACEVVMKPVSFYAQNPDKRVVKVDGESIYVIRQMGSGYVAWGGGKQRDKWTQYKQRRAIEMVSGCRVSEVASKKTDEVLYAFVTCD